jgi:hypothetical protein
MASPKFGIVSGIIAALFILLFVYTSLNKLASLKTFRMTLYQSPWLSDHAGWITITLPVAELLTALLLFIPSARLYGLYSTLILLLGFTIYLGYMIAFAPHLPCSCGGVLSGMTWKQHLAFNMVFILLGILGIWVQKKSGKKVLTWGA